MGIGETLCRALAKVITRAAGYQVKTVCGNLQLCPGLETGIEGSTHAICKWRIKQVRERSSKEVAEDGASNEEKESGGMATRLHNLIIDTAGTEEE